ncbi:MAG: competence protein ComK [Acholeplasmataceae bacterium]|nr:competence protein ComK [Acholeplasmataceae bacterium]
MNYIINTAYGCKLYQHQSFKEEHMNAFTYIKKICLTQLFTYKGYIFACQKTFNFKYKIPLYITDSLQFIPSKNARDYDSIWINYANVYAYVAIKNGISITFYDGTKVDIKISIKTFKTQINRLNLIREVKVKHFHS